MFYYIIPALIFGWALGTNSAANVFGPPVASKMIKYQNAVLLSAVFIVLGAVFQGQNGIETIRGFSSNSILLSSISVLSAAITLMLMTYLKVPVSSSQAIIGSIIGINLITNQSVEWSALIKIISAWIATPLGGAFFGFISYKLFAIFIRKIKSIVLRGRLLKLLTIIFGCYGAYALGANNVANITGVFADDIGIINATLVGGIAIASGVLTFSKRIMLSVGKDIAALDYYTSTIVVFAESITVWIFALIGVPVSISQAVLGAIIGSSLAAGNTEINRKQVSKMIIAWVNTPVSAGLLAIAMIFCLRFMGFSIQ